MANGKLYTNLRAHKQTVECSSDMNFARTWNQSCKPLTKEISLSRSLPRDKGGWKGGISTMSFIKYSLLRSPLSPFDYSWPTPIQQITQYNSCLARYTVNYNKHQTTFILLLLFVSLLHWFNRLYRPLCFVNIIYVCGYLCKVWMTTSLVQIFYCLPRS